MINRPISSLSGLNNSRKRKEILTPKMSFNESKNKEKYQETRLISFVPLENRSFPPLQVFDMILKAMKAGCKIRFDFWCWKVTDYDLNKLLILNFMHVFNEFILLSVKNRLLKRHVDIRRENSSRKWEINVSSCSSWWEQEFLWDIISSFLRSDFEVVQFH